MDNFIDKLDDETIIIDRQIFRSEQIPALIAELKQYVPLYTKIDTLGLLELPERPAELLTENELKEIVLPLLAAGKKVQAIKFVQNETSCGLKYAKNFVESLQDLTTFAHGRDDIDRLIAIVKEHHPKKIYAIKALRKTTGWGLLDAKNFVEMVYQKGYAEGF